jgi:Ca-activated chloride channel family protein
VPISTIVVGTQGGVVTRKLTGGFQELIRVPASPRTLQQLAEATGGEFFSAANDPRVRDVFQKLGSRLGHRNENRELTDVFAGGSALLLLAGAGLSTFWFRRAP